jgi:fatty-acyl-CoA synthase
VDTKTEISYGQLEQKANRIAKFINENIDDSSIGLYEKNSINFLAAIIGIGKARRLAILFNIREPENRITQLAKDCQVKSCFGKKITGVKCFDIDEVIQQEHLSSILPKSQSYANIEDPAFVIFTSGTSGPSKPALFSHKRMLGAGMAWSIRTGMTSTDRCYITLPLCHGNALAVAFSNVVYAGGTAILREQFSVSHFWEDIRNFDCTNMVYIGELWRYLLNVPEQPNDSQNPLEVIFGNGLKTDIWRNTLERFNILHVVEHFGATEMPAGALTNWTDRPGFCGFIPSGYTNEKAIVLLDENNREVSYNYPGQAVFQVPDRKYRGYLHLELDKDKLLHDLVKPGDLWWQSGDVLTRDKEGFFTFIERMGDSYRFKGENISNVDVENVLYKLDLIAEVCVYGIKLPWLDGQAGMATLRLKDENISLTRFLANLL